MTTVFKMTKEDLNTFSESMKAMDKEWIYVAVTDGKVDNAYFATHKPDGTSYEFSFSSDIKPGAEQGTFTDEQPFPVEYSPFTSNVPYPKEQCLGTGVSYAADGKTPNGTFSMWKPKKWWQFWK